MDEDERRYEHNGMQIVEVDGYAYLWHGDPPLAVGEQVHMLRTWLDELRGDYPEGRTGKVTALGTTYDGELQSVIARINTLTGSPEPSAMGATGTRRPSGLKDQGMKFVLEVDMGDMALDGNAAVELGRILRYWGGNLHKYDLKPGDGSAIYDSDYREVGRWSITTTSDS